MTELNRNDQLTIGTDSFVVTEQKDNQNARRSSIILINTSVGGQIITLTIGAPAVANKGIVLAVGGSWNDSRDGGYWPTQQQIEAISSAAGGLLSIQERIIKSD